MGTLLHIQTGVLETQLIDRKVNKETERELEGRRRSCRRDHFRGKEKKKKKKKKGKIRSAQEISRYPELGRMSSISQCERECARHIFI